MFPTYVGRRKFVIWLSPRMRGCFFLRLIFLDRSLAFPAYAGMFPAHEVLTHTFHGFPRVCGDVSEYQTKYGIRIELSPRMRGCFPHMGLTTWNAAAFPAYAGMFLASLGLESLPLSFPRVCGDVSTFAKCALRVTLFSPRMRGCFWGLLFERHAAEVLPAYAGIFLPLKAWR